jgi:hypothetical protein
MKRYLSSVKSKCMNNPKKKDIYRNKDNDPTIIQWHKIAALRLAADFYEKKFGMFQNGPAVMI